MVSLKDIQSFALAELEKKFPLNPVTLKHSFPERPLRTLGLVKVDGDVFNSEKFTRVVLLRIDFPFYLAVRSFFILPRMELDLPVFVTETVITGKKRLFIVDVHRTGENRGYDDSKLFNDLIEIRKRYPALLEKATKRKTEIESVFSKAACKVKINEEQDGQALSIFQEYLEVFLEVVKNSVPLSGEALEKTRQAFEGYLKTVADHDPGVKGYQILFGKKQGLARALDISFGL
jgi:hypothetical protein